MAGAADGDPCHEIEKQIAIDIFDYHATTLFDDQGINTPIGRCRVKMVSLDERFGLRSRERRLDLRCLHNLLSIAFQV
jgi:hypothetical protein